MKRNKGSKFPVSCCARYTWARRRQEARIHAGMRAASEEDRAWLKEGLSKNMPCGSVQ